MQSVLVILAVSWSVYVVMWLLSRHERRSLNSIASFSKHLAILGRTPVGSAPAPPVPAGPLAPVPAAMTLYDARTRRRRVLTALAAGASVTAAGAVVGGPPLVPLHVLADVLLLGYLLLLARTQQASPPRPGTVVPLPRPAAPVAVEPAYLRRSAN